MKFPCLDPWGLFVLSNFTKKKIYYGPYGPYSRSSEYVDHSAAAAAAAAGQSVSLTRGSSHAAVVGGGKKTKC